MTASGSGASEVSNIARLLKEVSPFESFSIGDHRLRLTADFSAEMRTSPNAASVRLPVIRLLNEVHSDLILAAETAVTPPNCPRRPIISGDLAHNDASYTDEDLRIGGQQVMQAWEAPYMLELARAAGETKGDVLEIGFGMGISSSFLQQYPVRSHTIIECHPQVLTRCSKWRSAYPGRDIRIVPGRWQDTVEHLDTFDAVIFDAYPLNEEEWLAHYANDTTYAGHFFPVAARLLRAGGVFSYYTNEVDSMSRCHQRAILKHFSNATISRIDGLTPPLDCHYWQSSSMLVVVARK